MKSVIALLAVGSAACVSSAQVQVYTSLADWQAALTGSHVLEDFNSTATQDIADGSTLDTGLLQITRDGSGNSGDGALAISPGSVFGNIDGTNFLDGETGGEPHETVNFGFNGGNVYAFGADFTSPYSGDGIDIVANGQRYSLADIGGGNSFFGIVDVSGASLGDVSIAGTLDSITFQELWQADNFRYALVPTPAGASILGIVGLAAARRRR